MRTFVTLLAMLGPAAVAAIYGVDVSQPVSVSAAKCMRSNGRTFASVRGWCSFGGIDSNVVDTVANFWAGGFASGGGLQTLDGTTFMDILCSPADQVDIYAFPCRAHSATTQANSLVSYLHNHSTKFDKIWLDVETNPSPGCGWGVAFDEETGYRNDTLASANCDYIGEWMSALTAQGVTPGVYASEHMWNLIPGSACTVASAHPLWYADYDGVPNFSDFVPFGGWKTPAIKQYSGTGSLCGVGVDSNWHP